MWLIERLSPDFKTIADFRKDNGKAIRQVCREFVVLCRRLDLFSEAIVAIDSSQFKAVNNRDKNFPSAKKKRPMEQLDKSIERYLGQLYRADREEPAIAEAKTARLKEQLAAPKQEMQHLQDLEARMLEAPDQQISLTEQDARSPKTRGNGIVGYDVQIAVDTEQHLIAAHEVTNTGGDRSQLATMAKQARDAMGTEDFTAIPDPGYFKGEEILECHQSGIQVILPKPQTSGSQVQGRFGKWNFYFVAEDDTYRSPAGERLTWRITTQEKGQTLHRYWSSACPHCEIKVQRRPSPYRRVTRWQHEAVLEAVQARLYRDPAKTRTHCETAEHPFGTIKVWMGAAHYLLNGLPKFKTAMSLHVLAYNLKRGMNTLGVASLIPAVQA
jgi:transposase